MPSGSVRGRNPQRGLLVILAAVSVLTLILYRIRRVNIDRFAPPLSSIRSIASEAKTGDLVLCSGDTATESSTRFWTGSPFSHVMLVISCPTTGIPYCFEADIGGGFREGARVLPLETKLEKWSHRRPSRAYRMGALLRSRLPRPSYEKMMEVISRHSNLGLDRDMVTWIRAGSMDPTARRKDVFCSELVAMVLQDIYGLEIFPGHPASYSPATFEGHPAFDHPEIYEVRFPTK